MGLELDYLCLNFDHSAIEVKFITCLPQLPSRRTLVSGAHAVHSFRPFQGFDNIKKGIKDFFTRYTYHLKELMILKNLWHVFGNIERGITCATSGRCSAQEVILGTRSTSVPLPTQVSLKHYLRGDTLFPGNLSPWGCTVQRMRIDNVGLRAVGIFLPEHLDGVACGSWGTSACRRREHG